MGGLEIRVSPQAERHIQAIASWWAANREAAPTLFKEELGGAFRLISGAPEAGKPYRLSPLDGVRRILLRRTRYHIYYRVEVDEVRVLAVWHNARGQQPELR